MTWRRCTRSPRNGGSPVAKFKMRARSYEWFEKYSGGPALPMLTVDDMARAEARGAPYWVSGDDTARNSAGRDYGP